MRATVLVLVSALLCGCGDDATVVRVKARPTVGGVGEPEIHTADRFAVTLKIGGTESTKTLSLGGRQFPGPPDSVIDFSFSAPDRSGPVEIQVDALDADGLLIGRGKATTTVGTESVEIMMEGADFVVNPMTLEDQFMSNDADAYGFQLAALANGTWTVAFRERCLTPCDMYGRRFDATGLPVDTQLGGGKFEFKFSSSQTMSTSIPALASADNKTVALWDVPAITPQLAGINCRSIDEAGAQLSAERSVSSGTIADSGADVVSLAPLSNGTFAAIWGAFQGGSLIRTAIIRSDCTVATAASTASTSGGAISVAHRPTVASTKAPGGKIMFGWILDDSAHIRIADSVGVYNPGTDQQFLAKSSSVRVEHIRIAPLSDGYAVFVRRATIDEMGTGTISMFHTDPEGVKMGDPVEITNLAGADSLSKKSFGVAVGADNSLMVVWHACGKNGDGSNCGVWGQFVGNDLALKGAAFLVPTTIAMDQTGPSVVGLNTTPASYAIAWRDDSKTAPDSSGSAVRARILYAPD
jgi:hypothetical protein